MEWGVPGTGEGQFNRPVGVETDAAGFIYVVESYNHRLQKFSSTGEFIEMWGWGVATGATAYERCTSGCQEGIPGSGDGQFDGPFDVAIDAAGDVYVSEYGQHRVQKFDSEGNFLLKWGSFGSNDGQFFQPNALTTSVTGDIYVSDYHNHRVQKFDSDGNFLLKCSSPRTWPSLS
jgi:DNA-binding beta-propeller fold protein YncE